MKRSSLLLAGGLGSRMNGREKALIMCQQKTLLERSLAVLDNVSDEVIVSLRDEEQWKKFSHHTVNRKVVTDSMRNAGPLAGIFAGFKRAHGDYVFTVACDMPFLNEMLISMMFDMVDEHDAIIPVNEHGTKETLHSIYRRDTMLDAVVCSIKEGKRSILAPVSLLEDVLYIDAEVIKKVDKELKSLVNINTPSDMIELENRIYDRL